MNVEEALVMVDNLIQPQRLSTLQEMIFQECWKGKTYQQIAENSDYDADYIRVVGSRLWQSLTEACAEKVTKNNFRSILRQQSQQNVVNNVALELPNGPMAADSFFYIERPPIEEICRQEIAKPGALIRIKATKNMGKKSLLKRVLADGQTKYNIVKLDLQQADNRILENFSQLLRWFCANLCYALNIENIIDEYWDEDLGVKVSCTSYLQDHILDRLEKPLVLALDRMHVIFECTDTAREFLPLLRFWHEEAKNLSVWQKLRLIVIQSTESYVPLNLNQSPFNVGLPVVLPEFNRLQMMELAQKYQLNWNGDSEDKLSILMELIGGHPYLARLAFYHLVKDNLSFEEFITNAPTETSIYRDILRYYLTTLYENKTLAEAFKKTILSEKPVQLETITAYKLESLGLVDLKGNEVVPSCQLYRLYFKDRLDNI